MTGLALSERVNLEIAEQAPKSDVFLNGDWLVTHNQHLVIEPCLAELVKGLPVDTCHIDTGDLRSERCSNGLKVDTHLTASFPLQRGTINAWMP